MALGETESGLFGLFANEPTNVFEPMGAALERLGAGCIQDRPGMFPDEPAQPHDRAQRLWAARIESTLGPLSALLTKYRRSADPITARGKNRGAEPTRPEAVTELAGLLASVHPDLFHAFIEDPHAAAIPAYPDFAADQFRWRFVKGSFDFHVAVAMNAAPAFLEAGKEQSRQRLQVWAFLFKAGRHLFACRAMDTLVGDTTFPVTKKEIFFTQRLEASSLQRVGAHVSDPALYFTFGENCALQIVEVSAQEFSLSHTLSIL